MLIDVIRNYSFENILAIEESDRQFLALKSAWELLENRFSSVGYFHIVQEVFLRAVIYNALISYQIAGSGELRWEEFSQKIVSDFDLLLLEFLQEKPALDRWYNLMISSKYNKRLYNIKISRLKKVSLFGFADMKTYHDNMSLLWHDLAIALSVCPYSKTIVFAVKMFGYVSRFLYPGFVSYPMDIPIPVDSRIRKMFVQIYQNISDKEIIEKTFELSRLSGIAPLHLDSLFWVKR